MINDPQNKEPEFYNIHLGHAIGNDDELRALIERLCKYVNDNYPEDDRDQVKRFRDHVAVLFGRLRFEVIKALDWIKDNFSHQNTARAVAQKAELQEQSDQSQLEGTVIAKEKEQGNENAPPKVVKKPPVVLTTENVPEEFRKLIELLNFYEIICLAEKREDGSAVIFFSKKIDIGNQGA